MNENEKRDIKILNGLHISASEILYSAFLHYLKFNPISTAAFIEDLVNAFEWVEEPQKQSITDKIYESLMDDTHKTDDALILWECALTNLLT